MRTPPRREETPKQLKVNPYTSCPLFKPKIYNVVGGNTAAPAPSHIRPAHITTA